MILKNSKFFDFRFLLYAFILLLIVMFVLPFYSADTYSIVRNTTSQLGAQSTKNAWIMNATFILVGISCIIEAWLHLGNFWFQKILLNIFGLGLICTAIFHHAPVTEGVIFSAREDDLHSVVSSIVGITFIIYAISSAFIEKTTRNRTIDILVGLAASLFSFLMLTLPDYAGIWQRTMFIISFVWLIWMLERIKAFTKSV